MCGPWEETFAAAKLPSKPYNDDDDNDDDDDDDDDDGDDCDNSLIVVLSYTSPNSFWEKCQTHFQSCIFGMNLGNFFCCWGVAE